MSTEYVILSRTEKGAWEEIGKAAGPSANAAIRERLNGSQQSSEYRGDGEYVAIPARSWKPVQVKSETALKFS